MKKQWLIYLLIFGGIAGFILNDVAFAAHVNLKATLTGAQEVPPVTTNATGTAVLTLTPSGGLTFFITVNGLSGAITAAHFHLGAPGVVGPPIFTITDRFGGGTSATGTWRSTDTPALVDSVIAAFLTGRIYVNIHTAANPNGEIRGQVVLASGTAFYATLEGAQEFPSVTTSASGTAALTLSSVGGVGLTYRITVNGLSGPITGAHFHLGFPRQNGDVFRNITNEFRNNTASGVWRTGTGTGVLVDSLIVALFTGRIYLNVHTAANPNGEIRGQVHLSAGFGFTANLEGAQEVPPVTTNAKGTASLTLTEYGLVYNVTVDGLSGPITAAHFHRGPAGSTGNVVRDLVFSNNTTSGIWKSNDPQPFSPALLQALLADSIYINVHTAANPTGEIRGQVMLKQGSGASARLDGLQEVPPLTNPNNAKGTASLTATPTGVAYDITVTGLSGAITNAHFHLGGIGTSGNPVKTITSNFTGNTAKGVWGTADAQEPFTEDMRTALVTGKLYLNVHTAANPAGELRGQVLVDAGAGFHANIEGSQENPPLTNNATGTGSFTLTRGGLRYQITVNGLSGAITAAHFHLGSRGVNGNVVRDITVTGNSATGYWRTTGTQPLVDSLIVALLTGRIYVNFHTAANPTGEIRGQVEISEGTGLTAFLNGRQEVPPVSTNARGSAALVLNDAGITFHTTVDGLSGSIANAHFHNAPAGTNGSVVRTITRDFRGNTAAGLWRSTDTEALSNMLLRQALASRLYLNVHTAANPTGEIRGQVVTGAAIFTSVNSRSIAGPGHFALAQNYPNPFNPSTAISYNLPKNARVKLVIYDLLGKTIRTLVDANETAGTKEIVWDGVDDTGGRVASGIYFYQLTTGDAAGIEFVSTRKLLLMK